MEELEERVRRLEDGGRGEEEEKGGRRDIEEKVKKWSEYGKERRGKKKERDGERQEEGEGCEDVIGEIFRQIGTEVRVEKVQAVRAGR